MDLITGMRAFVATVDAESFSKAARELNTSKATISKQVSTLEDRLGVRLLQRTTRTLNLTDEGRIFVQRARQILMDLEDAQEAISPVGAQLSGSLRISAPHTFGATHLTQALAAFAARFPHLHVNVEFSDRMTHLIDEGFDVAVRISRLKDSSLIARKIAPVPLVLCASPAYWQEHGTPEHPHELAREFNPHKCVMYAYLSTPGEWSFQENGTPFSVKISSALTTNHDSLIRAAAINGLGIFFGPSFIVREALDQGLLTPALAKFLPDPLAVHAVYPSSRNLSPKVRAFVDFLVEWFKDTPL